MMNTQERIDLVNELLRTTQVIRKNAMGNEGRYVLDGAFAEVYDRLPSDGEAEKILTEMFPYLFGPDSIMHYLILLSMRSEPPTDMEMYNILTIVHRLDKTGIIRMAYEIYTNNQPLPEPSTSMCLLGL